MSKILFLANLGSSELFMLSILPIFSMILCIYRAGKINQNRIIWGLLGLFMNFLAVIVIYLLPKKSKEDSRQIF